MHIRLMNYINYKNLKAVRFIAKNLNFLKFNARQYLLVEKKTLDLCIIYVETSSEKLLVNIDSLPTYS